MNYKSYHTNIKILTQKGSLPSTYLEEINRSTIWRWKQEPKNKYIGTELSEIDILENFINREEAKKLMKVYLKAAFSIGRILNTAKSFRLNLKNNKAQLVKTILSYKNTLNFKLLLRILNIPINVFYYWKDQVLYQCSNSYTQLCKRKYPNQLTQSETAIIKELFLAEKYQYWPICSIAYYALRENILSISRQTWYKYIKLLGLKRPGIAKKKKYTKGITARFTNEYWHADITIVKSLDGVKNYVYLLMDNFSKYIINWRVESLVSGHIRLQTIKDAYNSISAKQEVKLVIDGGSENNNLAVNNYTDSNEVKIIKLVALKDIPFSNSLVEAQNKLLKYRYLFKQQFYNINDLRKALEWIIDDYNNKRPHISTNGLTPYEAYNGICMNKNQINEQIRKAKIKRLAENKKSLCGICD